ncbi:MAG: ferritin-like domain-containing protein [Gammaproteobacteria bacterium]|nr:ferritin-like domain-containing protein [Gammaproteobacteria bacterium]MBU2546083.1 ferritin-like domain-containing protein [Gammaproteobacteria bacterium]
MTNINQELIDMLNQALRLEHAARIQYLAHAELVSGINAEGIVARLKELASDEAEHEEKFRTLIGNYLGGEPTMELAETHRAKDVPSILKTNLQNEKEAIDFYKEIYRKIVESKDQLPYCFTTLEHEVRHIILDEEEHISEISNLIG